MGLSCPRSSLCWDSLTGDEAISRGIGLLGRGPKAWGQARGDTGQGARELRGAWPEGFRAGVSPPGSSLEDRAYPLVHCPSADGGRSVVRVLKSQVEGHYILYCETDMHGQQVRMAKLVGESGVWWPQPWPPPLCLLPLP